MIVKGSEVKPRNWTRFLCEQGTYTYRPSGGGMTAEPSPLATVCFGYQVPLGKLVEEFSQGQADTSNVGTRYERLANYMGVF